MNSHNQLQLNDYETLYSENDTQGKINKFHEGSLVTILAKGNENNNRPLRSKKLINIR